MPAGFPAYVRVLHPVGRVAGDRLEPVSWAETAEANGTRGHRAMQIGGLTGSVGFNDASQPRVYDVPPQPGSLPEQVTGRLAAVLGRHTKAPERCWYAVWDGFGDTRADVRAAARFHLPAREYHLLVGPLSAATERMGALAYRSASVGWSDDRAWCVASEIDVSSAWVECTEACSDEMRATAGIEAVDADPSDRVDWYGDAIDPPVPGA